MRALGSQAGVLTPPDTAARLPHLQSLRLPTQCACFLASGQLLFDVGRVILDQEGDLTSADRIS